MSASVQMEEAYVSEGLVSTKIRCEQNSMG
jgi:hypothetical protein